MEKVSNDKSGHAARKAALRALSSIMEDGETLDQALEEAFTGAGKAGVALPPRDRAFVYQLVATTLRRMGQIDRAIKKFLQKPLPKKAEDARHILRLGAAQAMFMNVSAHAIVDTSVAMAASARNPNVRRLKGLVNAVLRRITEQSKELASATGAEPLGNLPLWLRKSWLAHFGQKKTEAIALAILQEPPLDLTPNIAKVDTAGEVDIQKMAQTLAQKTGAEILPNGSLRLQSSGRIEELPGFKEGQWWVQDAAAAIPVHLLGDVNDKPVADLCAAPGGKTLQLAAKGARVTAIDKSDKRLARLRENLFRTELSADVMTSDVLKWKPETPPEAILLDAPCSATGTLRRHPDVSRIKSAADVLSLVPLQAQMLDHAFSQLAPGGTLIYCVCSLQAEEGPDQISAFLARTPAAARVAVQADEMPGLADTITADGDVQTLPCYWPGAAGDSDSTKGGMDGFFITRMEKREAQ